MHKNTLKLYAPESYWNAPKSEIDQNTGGCGPGGFGDLLVPDKIWGISVKAACKIHDWMYYVGGTIQDKDEADRVFLNNMVRIIMLKTRYRFLLRLRIRTAKTYYNFVKDFGSYSFWKDKNDESQYREVITL